MLAERGRTQGEIDREAGEWLARREMAGLTAAEAAAFEAWRAADPAHARAFLYRTAHNIVMDHRRREAVRARLSTEIAIVELGDGPANTDAERVLSGRERLAIVDAAVRAMEPRRRKVLIMHAIHGLNYTEIGRRMRISPTRVTQLFADAVAICNKALRDADEGGCGAG